MLADKLRAASAGVSDPAWNISRASFTGTPKNFLHVGDKTGAPGGIFFSSDGLNLYFVAIVNPTNVYQYTLTSAWNISSATYLQSFTLQGSNTFPTGLFFSADGLRMFVCIGTTDSIDQYSLTTAWDVSTASYLMSFSVAGQETAPEGVFFRDNGLSMYIVGSSSDSVHQYTLSTAWNISTATFTRSFSVSGQDTIPTGVFFSGTGTQMYVLGDAGDDVNEYSLSTAWDISTATFQRTYGFTIIDTNPRGFFFKSDGLRLYVSGGGDDAIYQFALSTAWNISTTTFTRPSRHKYVGDVELFARGQFFRDNGLTWYVIGSNSDNVREYSLSTAWEISTATLTRSFSVSAKETDPSGIFFRDNGLSMYIVGSSSDSVHQYTLSTAWNISTATFTRSFSVASQTLVPEKVFFKPDGLVMYVGSDTALYEYGLSTAWDISTSFFVQSVSGLGFEFTFSPDGKYLFKGDISQYLLSTAWDITTATLIRSLSVESITSQPAGIVFKPDGMRFFFVSFTGVLGDSGWAYDIA